MHVYTHSVCCSAVGSASNGTVIGPSDNLYTLPAEAVGRTAVTLSGAGQYVDFTLAKPDGGSSALIFRRARSRRGRGRP
jgi:hypothetical protein